MMFLHDNISTVKKESRISTMLELLPIILQQYFLQKDVIQKERNN